MKYIADTIANTQFDLRRVVPRSKSDLINDLGNIEVTNPTDGATGVLVNETITWDAIDGYDRYRIIIKDQSDDSIVVNTSVSSTSYTPSFDASTGYDIQVFTARRIPQQEASTITGISITGSSSLEENNTTQLQANVTGTGNYSSSVTWSSSNEAVATVDQNGLVTYVSGNPDDTVDIIATSDQDNSFFDTHTLTIQGSSGFVQQDSLQGDRDALTALKASTNGANWNNVWNDTTIASGDLSTLYGVTTDANGRVLSLKLNGNETIGDWTDIESPRPEAVGIDGGNNLVGELPIEILNLQKCRYINVKQNFLTGSIPNLGLMGDLEWISLGGQYGEIDLRKSAWNENNHSGAGSSAGKGWYESNEFSGSIPPDIFDLPNLIMFECRRQYLTGVLPDSVWRANNIIGIFLNDTKGTNPLGDGQPLPARPDGATGLQNLRHFHIDTRSNINIVGAWNQEPDATLGIVGVIPLEWEELPAMNHFRVRDQNLTGAFPALQSLDMRVLTASGNHFTGGFPIGYFQGNNAILNNFIVGNNSLDGEIPTNFVPPTTPISQSNYHSMSKFNIPNCGFTGELPDWIQEMSGHQVFIIDGNNFTDVFPEKLMDRSQMKTLLMRGNNFYGDLPDRQWDTSRLISLMIDGNNFTGVIPAGWSSLTNSSNRMLYLYMYDNDLEGLIPSWMADIIAINRIRLQNNRFTYKDIIPHEPAISANATEDYTYSPQKAFNVPQDSFTDIVGSTVTVDLSSIDYINNVYQWQKLNGSVWENVSGETSHTLVISNAQISDSGTYRLRITNPDLPNLTESLSREITINIE